MVRKVIKEISTGQRLDVFATETLPTLSRAYVAKLIEDERILVNNEASKPGYKLRLGDKVLINFDVSEIEQIPDIELPILYQDEDVLVINKPEGVISHSRGKYWNEPSVASFVRQITGLEGDRSGIVHRLDRATSGVMICAKNQASLSWLQKQFSQRKVKKTYTAVVKGHLNPPEAVIDMPIERNPKAPSTFRIGANGKQATTTYAVIESSNHHDMVRLEPLTGRTHQLRVHLTYQGHPIVGDGLYNGESFERLLLHATSLEITMPNKQRKVISAPLPKIFKQFVAGDV